MIKTVMNVRPILCRNRLPQLWRGVLGLVVSLGFLAGTLAQQPADTVVKDPNLGSELPGETQAFAVAARAFQDGLYLRAENQFADFIRLYPASPRVPEAVLLQARAALEQERIQNAISLLSTNFPQAGTLTEQYRYWLAKAQMKSQNYQAAADSFALLASEFTNSIRLLEAGYEEALARFKLKQWSRVVALLQEPSGTFRRGAAIRANDELVMLGELLLAEALLEKGDFAASETLLLQLGQADLIPNLQWRRLHLLCRVLLADQRVAAALAATTNLLTIAASSDERPVLQAESYLMQGAILEQLGQWPAALEVFLKNLDEGVPAEQRRKSLLKVIQLTVDLGQYQAAAQRLESFFAQYPKDPATDVALLTYGELYLKQALATWGTNIMDAASPAPTAITNDLLLAQARFQQLLTNYPQSNLAGLARLNEGWTWWLQGKIPESRESFRQAAALLPVSSEKSTALFKLGDAQYLLGDYTNALAQYRAVVSHLGDLPEMRDTLMDRALFQVTRTCLRLGDFTGATQAMNQLLEEMPQSPFAEPMMLLLGQDLCRAGQSKPGRAVLESCAKRFPNGPLFAQVQLAIARSYTWEKDWTAAIAAYEAWLERFPTNAIRPRAEFSRAWANAQAGLETNALRLFTNFTARFPSHELAPQACYWVADFYFNQKDYVNAQLNYQDAILLSSPLAYRARMMAGRAAFAGERWTDAIDNFKALLNDNQCPPPIVVEALFGLGDTYTRQASSQERPVQKYEEAIAVFMKIPQLYPDDPRVPNAWGRIGDCYFTMAGANSKNYTSATNEYHKILASPAASVAARSQAELGLAMAKEGLAATLSGPESAALRKAALDHYLNVVYGTSSVLKEGEKPDPFWIKEAGLAGARLAEEQEQWDVAINLYSRLARILPALQASLEKRIQKAREQLPPR